MSALVDRRGSEDYQPRRWMLWLYGALIGLALLTLVGRLFVLQVRRGEELTAKGAANFIEQMRLPADRGFIYDARGLLLVDNRPSLDVYLTPAFVGEGRALRAAVGELGELLAMPEAERRAVAARLGALRGLDRFVPQLVRRDLTRAQLAEIENRRSLFMLDGVEVRQAPYRRYRHGKTLGHVLGYLNEIGPQELKERQARGQDYRLGDMLGRTGLEREYEPWLRGRDGYQLIIKDARGRRRHGAPAPELLAGRRPRLDPVPGASLVLTLDLALQQAAEQAFIAAGAREGALVALDVQTGAVLALVSLPLVDPNELASRPDQARWRALVEDPDKPLIDRVLQEHYAPGSTYKVVTALAALEHGLVRPSEQVRCPGWFKLGDTRWRCWSDRGHGLVDLRTAIERSCDVYFYTLGARVQLDGLAETARELGFGQRTGIRLGLGRDAQGRETFEEEPGIIPDVAWRRRQADGWRGGDVINNAIGQGDTNVTPLQLALAYAAIANGGRLLRPRLVERIEDHRGAWLAQFGPETLRELRVATPDLAIVHAGLCDVVNQPRGTAWYRRSRRLTVCGKTGTAQVVRLGEQRHDALTDVPYQARDHAWFVGFAPGEEPRVVVAVVHEHGGHGSSGAAPIAVKTIEAWWELSEQRQRAPAAGVAGALADGAGSP